MSKTPRVDALECSQYDACCAEFVVSSEEARKMELESAQLLNALQYAYDAIDKMADHCDMEAVEELGLDVQDCRDCVSFAIERAGGEVSV